MLGVVSSWWRHLAPPAVQRFVETTGLVLVLLLVGVPVYLFCGGFYIYCRTTTTAFGRWRGHAMWQRYRVHGHSLPGRVVQKSRESSDDGSGGVNHVYSVEVEYLVNHHRQQHQQQQQRQYRYTRTFEVKEEKEWQALRPDAYHDDLVIIWPGHPKSAQLSSTVRQVDPDFLPCPDLEAWLGLVFHYMTWLCGWLPIVLACAPQLFYPDIWWLVFVGAPLFGLTLYYWWAKRYRDAELHRMLYGAQRVTASAEAAATSSTTTMYTLDSGDSNGEDSDPAAEVNHDDYHHHEDDDDPQHVSYDDFCPEDKQSFAGAFPVMVLDFVVKTLVIFYFTCFGAGHLVWQCLLSWKVRLLERYDDDDAVGRVMGSVVCRESCSSVIVRYRVDRRWYKKRLCLAIVPAGGSCPTSCLVELRYVSGLPKSAIIYQLPAPQARSPSRRQLDKEAVNWIAVVLVVHIGLIALYMYLFLDVQHRGRWYLWTGIVYLGVSFVGAWWHHRHYFERHLLYGGKEVDSVRDDDDDDVTMEAALHKSDVRSTVDTAAGSTTVSALSSRDDDDDFIEDDDKVFVSDDGR